MAFLQPHGESAIGCRRNDVMTRPVNNPSIPCADAAEYRQHDEQENLAEAAHRPRGPRRWSDARRRPRHRTRAGCSRRDGLLHRSKRQRQAIAVRTARNNRGNRGDHQGRGWQRSRAPRRSHARERGTSAVPTHHARPQTHRRRRRQRGRRRSADGYGTVFSGRRTSRMRTRSSGRGSPPASPRRSMPRWR